MNIGALVYAIHVSVSTYRKRPVANRNFRLRPLSPNDVLYFAMDSYKQAEEEYYGEKAKLEEFAAKNPDLVRIAGAGMNLIRSRRSAQKTTR